VYHARHHEIGNGSASATRAAAHIWPAPVLARKSNSPPVPGTMRSRFAKLLLRCEIKMSEAMSRNAFRATPHEQSLVSRNSNQVQTKGLEHRKFEAYICERLCFFCFFFHDNIAEHLSVQTQQLNNTSRPAQQWRAWTASVLRSTLWLTPQRNHQCGYGQGLARLATTPSVGIHDFKEAEELTNMSQRNFHCA